MTAEIITELRRQNRLLKAGFGLALAGITGALLMGAKEPANTAKFDQIDVRRINIVNADGSHAMVLASQGRLPSVIVDGQSKPGSRDRMPGMIFYGSNGDEIGGLIYDARMGANGKPEEGVHLSMDRYGGDQQLALHHYESGGFMDTGLSVYDRGLEKDYGPIYEEYRNAPPGPEKDALLRRWQEAGGQQTTRLFVGRTKGKSSAVIMADDKGRPRIMMLVSPEGEPSLEFMDENGDVIQSLPQSAGTPDQ